MWMTHPLRLLGVVLFGSLALYMAHLAAETSDLAIRAAIGLAQHIWHYGQAGWNFSLPPPAFDTDLDGIMGSGATRIFVFFPLMIVLCGGCALISLIAIPPILTMAKRCITGDALALILVSAFTRFIVFGFIGMFAVMIGLAALIGLLVHKLPQHQPPSAHSQFESGG